MNSPNARRGGLEVWAPSTVPPSYWINLAVAAAVPPVSVAGSSSLS